MTDKTTEKKTDLRVGVVLVALDDFKMDFDGSTFLLKGKEYPVVLWRGNDIAIASETDARHYFDLSPDDPAYWRKFFYLKGEQIPAPLPQDGEEKTHSEDCALGIGGDGCDCGYDSPAPAEMSAEKEVLNFLLPRIKKMVDENPSEYQSFDETKYEELKETKMVVQAMIDFASLKAAEEIRKFAKACKMSRVQTIAESYIKNNLKG